MPSDRRPSPRLLLGLALFILAFNLWHNTTRGIWNGSVRDSLTMGPNVIGLAEQVDPKIKIRKPYDGQFTYAVTFDPLLITGKSKPYVLPLKYRYRRILLPLLAHAAALGQPSLFPYTLLTINLCGWFLMGWAAYKIGKEQGFSAPLAAAGVMVTTGITFSAFRTLPEPLAMGFTLTGVLFWLRDRKMTAALFFGLAGLARETALLTPLILAAYDVWKNKASIKNTVAFTGAALLPCLLWSGYLLARAGGGDIPLTNHIHFPFVGWFHDLQLAQQELTTNTERIRNYSILVFTVFLSAIGIWGLFQFPSVWGWLAGIEILFCSVMYGTIWSYYASAARVAAPLMIFSYLWFLSYGKNRQTERRTDKLFSNQNPA